VTVPGVLAPLPALALPAPLALVLVVVAGVDDELDELLHAAAATAVAASSTPAA
jgi:hypothetical protein